MSDQLELDETEDALAGTVPVYDDDGYLREDFLQRLMALLDERDAAAVRSVVEPLHETELADLLGR